MQTAAPDNAAFYNANKGVGTGDVTSGDAQKVSSIKSGIDKQKADTLSNMPVSNDNFSDSDIEKAVSGDVGQFNGINNWLKSSYQPTSQPIKTDATPNLDQYKSANGLQNIVSQNRGPTYSQGMSRVDAALARRDSNFGNSVNNLFANAGTIEGQAKDANSAITNADDSARAAFVAKQDALRNALLTKRNAMSSQYSAPGAVDEFSKQAYAPRNAADAAIKQHLKDVAAPYMQKVAVLKSQADAARASGDNIGYGKLSMQANILEDETNRALGNAKGKDSSQFTFGGDKYGQNVSQDDLYSQNDVNKWNSISDLLGDTNKKQFTDFTNRNTKHLDTAKLKDYFDNSEAGRIFRRSK